MDLVLVLLLALLLILITVSSSCGVKNEKYVVTGHNENANMLAEFNKKVEKFSNLREHFQGSDAEDSVEDKITAALTGEKKSRAEQKMDEKLKKEGLIKIYIPFLNFTEITCKFYINL